MKGIIFRIEGTFTRVSGHDTYVSVFFVRGKMAETGTDNALIAPTQVYHAQVKIPVWQSRGGNWLVWSQRSDIWICVKDALQNNYVNCNSVTRNWGNTMYVCRCTTYCLWKVEQSDSFLRQSLQQQSTTPQMRIASFQHISYFKLMSSSVSDLNFA